MGLNDRGQTSDIRGQEVNNFELQIAYWNFRIYWPDTLTVTSVGGTLK